MIEKLYESYDDNNYYVDANKKKLAHDNLMVVGGMLTFFLTVGVLFVAMALAFGNKFVEYIKYLPSIGVLGILLIIYLKLFRLKEYEFETSRIFCMIFYSIVALSFSIADSVIYKESRAVFFPLAIVMLSALYMDYFWVLFIYKLSLAVFFLVVDSQLKSTALLTNDITIAALAIIGSTFCYTSMISMTLSRHEESEELVHKSETDLLTGLLNKVSFEQKCDQYLAKKMAGGKCTMFIFDLDDFKLINDNFGHQTGDKVLKLFAEILQGYFHPDDLIGRIGGDEFMVLVLGEMPEGYVERRCRSVLHELKTTNIEGASGITCSMGIAESTQRVTFKDMYECSDKALYRAKEGGKARFAIESAD